MLAFIIILLSTLSQEVSTSIGKKAVARHKESIYAFCFLGAFWTTILMALGVLFGTEFRLSAESIPTLAVRITLICLLVYLVAMAVTKADRSTVGFLGSLTIPFLLIVDLAMGYAIAPLQIAGMVLLMAGIGWLFMRSKRSTRGTRYIIIGALVAVATVSLYKYNITHYNSVAGEQLATFVSVMVFFSILARLHRVRQPVMLVAKPMMGAQSFAGGIGMAIESYAYMYAPPSVVIALKRGLALVWSIIFGHKWFHEHKFELKLKSGAVVLAGIVLISVL